MKRFTTITSMIPVLESLESYGTWVEGKGGYSYASYPKPVMAFHNAMYDCWDKQGFGNYREALEESNILEIEDGFNALLPTADIKLTLSVLFFMVRSEHWSEGSLLDHFQSGRILSWLKHLAEIDN